MPSSIHVGLSLEVDQPMDIVFFRETRDQSALVMDYALAQVIGASDVEHVQSIVRQNVYVTSTHRAAPPVVN